MELAKITTRGQITIPIEIRKRLKLKESDKVVFVEKNGRIIMENAAKLAFANAQQAFQGEAERLNLKSEQDVVNMVKAGRGKKIMRIMLNTNVLISAILFPSANM